ncbi:MAG: flagellar biosynthesis protein FlhA [endosymbiont of Galathealinum brachiosum]|uniref:Flagellar biosynthesis protein FlhA n=1 Tax=endosymbiont of Galathealinum brachiosum TaxID=2200906 RepID=A0A370DAF2_9GAMM|nr:MAG: flagellar biosynthesis protein FlhA [endosymbiont of Galathealinum brachiosum]
MEAVVNNIQNMWRQGLMAPIAVIALLGMLIIPLPPIALDLFFTLNICLSIVIVLVSVYAQRPLDFVIFPTIILVATLFRLALNVASTRVVLLEGHTGTGAAGQVIESFGEFVIGGNYAVGLVVFAILVIINFVVVTKGAGRVSEVSARFTLDAMPGKQMAIDADLNSGIIDQEQAKSRREEIAAEADFYGSMDGASKFVRGDAVAGILILIINIVGGFAIGVGQHDMALSDAVRNYTLLTIGDGLVAQIPSLLLSSATAIIITRDSNRQDLGTKVKQQMFSNTKVLWVTAGIVGIMGSIPGMPNFAFLSIAGVLVMTAKWMDKNKQEEELQQRVQVEEKPEVAPEQKELSWDDVQPVDLIGLEVGYGLIPMVDSNQNGQLLNRIKGVRKKLSQELGFLIHSVHIRDNLDLSPNAYRITLNGVPVGESSVHPDREMAINPGQVYGQLQGMPGKDPAYGLDAVWVESGMRDHAQTLGYTVVDATTVVATHLNQILHDNAQELLGHEEVQQLLDNLALKSPKLVEDLVPKLLPLSVVVKVMQNLLSEGVSVRDIRTIAEVLAENGAFTQNPVELTAIVRIALGRSIIQKINGMEHDLPVITLEPSLEQLLMQSAQNASEGSIGVEPGLTERMFKSLEQVAEQQEMANQPAILVVAPPLRLWLSQLVKHSIAGLNVLSYSEIPDNKNIKVVASVGAD